MNAMNVLSSLGSFAIEFVYYLLLTAHVCLFIDVSPVQKYPMCKLNLLIASCIAALVPCVVINVTSFSSSLDKHLVGIGIAVVLSVAMALLIQRIIKIDIEF